MSHSVIFKNVTKKYKMYNKNSEKLMDVIFPDGYGEDFYALQNINFIADEGDVIGVIGVNGAGKSTLSNLITGVIPPTFGAIETKGQASLIAINSGLNNELTGRENIELKCLMLGFNKKEIRELMPDIIDFADIGKFIDQPVKSYSSGMKSRLGFAISVNIDPDILVIDEALSVGDQTFTDKCLDKMNEFKEKGKTIFFISHSIGQVKKFCQKALWLEAGEVRAYGTIQEIVPQYEKFLKEFKAMSKEEQKNFKQIVLEKRSKLRNQDNPSSLDKEEDGEIIPRGKTREKQKKKRKLGRFVKRLVILLFVFAIVLVGGGYIVKSGMLSQFIKDKPKSNVINNPEKVKENTEKKNTETRSETEDKNKIRYVTVDSGNIRVEPNMDSNKVASALFGQSFEILDSQKDSVEDFDWLKIVDNDKQIGWISSKIVTEIKEEVKDDEVAQKIDQLIGFTPSLQEAIPMIGKQQGEEQVFDYTEYNYVNNRVKGFTITVSDSSKEEVINALGEPQLKMNDGFLYHGKKFDYIFTIVSTGIINKLSVIER
ncbi:hypothetical protein J6TS2_17530 [Heyndrickxia sporothermodurans]|nr:hypothetical protein J6TS2_17530 [Heyndrickxia sporothermodurans]